MKLITAIAALALVAGSVDVDAQKRGDASKTPGGGKKPGAHQKAPEGAEEGTPQIAPAARLAMGTFNPLDTEECGDLAEEAKNGDEVALEALIAANVEALEEVIGGLQDKETLKWVQFGMVLATGWNQMSPDAKAKWGEGGHRASSEQTPQRGIRMVSEALQEPRFEMRDWSGGTASEAGANAAQFRPTDAWAGVVDATVEQLENQLGFWNDMQHLFSDANRLTDGHGSVGGTYNISGLSFCGDQESFLDPLDIQF